MLRILIIICLGLLTIAVAGQEVKKIKITDLEKTIKESKTPLIVNFWATFCKPCVEEIPYFQEAIKKYKKDSVRLLLVSLDLQDFYPVKIKSFAMKRKFTAPILWLDEYNADYFCPKVDSAWSGAIPASLFVNNRTGYRKFFEEQLSKEKLEKEIMAILGKTD
ncbi:MAG TPA: TlpA disulfide reductase family protein [Chitinophagaceae bacterium]|nr:TlpA disulfide reductase family protein [Chitinophagaceae bacterium]